MELTREEKIAKRRKVKRNRNILFTCMFLLLIFMTTATVFLLISYQNEKNKAEEAMNQKAEIEQQYITKEQAEALAAEQFEKAKEETSAEYLNKIQTMMENGDGTLTLLETLYPEKIVVPDSGRYYFFEYSETLEKNNYFTENFTFPVLNEETDEYEGEAYYQENGEVTSHKGIDVSKFQGDINWKKVAGDGVEFAYIRLGYRGYESGKIVTDEKYEDNISGCNSAGIDTGVYFFTEAKTKAEGIEEAKYVLEEIDGYRIDLPIVIDVEQSASKDNSRTKDLTAAERTEAVIAFCETIKEAGYEPMIYGNLKSMMLMLDMEQLEEYDKWFAYYHYPIRFPYKYRVWQYTASGDVDGIKGDTDLNIAFY